MPRQRDERSVGSIGEAESPPQVTVVVPIHNALPLVEQCVDSVLAHTTGRYRLLLLDDASTDPRLWPRLEVYCRAYSQVACIRHHQNRGFTATINHGCRLSGQDDVVLLNSDTVVTPRWLDKLTAASASRDDVATVTPLSNAAGAFSVPIRGKANNLPAGTTASDMAALLESLSEQLRPLVPTGNGFCLYVRRAALDAVGPFDEDAFAQGCGEENDFCMRASRLGFVHLIEDSTFVYHHRSGSLGQRKRWLLLKSAWVLRHRYPEYRRRVAEWLAEDPLDPLRERLQAIQVAAPSTDRKRQPPGKPGNRVTPSSGAS